jgi:drug/metabolite transporter (DMT)-like permease
MSFVMFTFALALFSAFKIGKVAVIESVLGLELPFTVALAILVGGEEMGTGQTIIFLIICIGVILASTKTFEIVSIHKRLFEKGVMLAFAAAGLSALSNYTMGISAQQVSPLMAVWYMHTVIGVLSLIALIISKEIFEIEHDLRTHPFLICGQSFFDNIAWIGYTYAVTYVPISTVAAISVSYVILASFLGYWFGHERLTSRQKIGSAIALPAVVLFAILSSAS